MPHLTKRQLLIAGLEARGYVASKYDPVRDAEQKFTISPSDKRRLADNAWRVVLTEASVRIAGRPIMLGLASSSPMPKAMREQLYWEGEQVLRRSANLVLEQEFGV